MKLTPAYVRSELQRIDERHTLELSTLTREQAYASKAGSLRGVLDSVLQFGLADEMGG